MNTVFKLALALASALLAVNVSAQTLYAWMNPEVGSAWSQGYRGQGVTVTVVDDFSSSKSFSGRLTNTVQLQRHGQWTSQETSLIAPRATIRQQDWTNTQAVKFVPGLNVANLSYGIYGLKGYSASQIAWSQREQSLISAAKSGTGIVVKAAGNDAVSVGSATSAGQVDYLNSALRGGQSAIYVGALNTTGTTLRPATIATYSNTAGTDTTVQRQFLVVGVNTGATGLAGTSFAAPIVTGYAAILGSKFTRATATQITNQLLNTARKDTVANYNVAVHGRGEASIARALAPAAIK